MNKQEKQELWQKMFEKRKTQTQKWVNNFDASSGKNIIRKYRRKFSVSQKQAVSELKQLGIQVTNQLIEEDTRIEKNHKANRRRRKLERKKKQQMEEFDPDFNYPGFYFVAGFTSGGAPYGITLEEAEQNGWLEESEEDLSDAKQSTKDTFIYEDDLPF